MTPEVETAREHESIQDQIDKLQRHTGVIVIDSARRRAWRGDAAPFIARSLRKRSSLPLLTQRRLLTAPNEFHRIRAVGVLSDRDVDDYLLLRQQAQGTCPFLRDVKVRRVGGFWSAAGGGPPPPPPPAGGGPASPAGGGTRCLAAEPMVWSGRTRR